MSLNNINQFNLRNDPLVGITLVFENCEYLFINSEDLVDFSFEEMPKRYIGIKNLKNNYFIDHFNSINNVNIVFNAKKYLSTESWKDILNRSKTFDVKLTPIERIQKYNDITQIEFVFKNQMNNSFYFEVLSVVFNNDNDQENAFQKSYLDNEQDFENFKNNEIYMNINISTNNK